MIHAIGESIKTQAFFFTSQWADDSLHPGYRWPLTEWISHFLKICHRTTQKLPLSRNNRQSLLPLKMLFFFLLQVCFKALVCLDLNIKCAPDFTLTTLPVKRLGKSRSICSTYPRSHRIHAGKPDNVLPSTYKRFFY